MIFIFEIFLNQYLKQVFFYFLSISFSAHFFCCLFIFLFNIIKKLILIHVKILIYFFKAVFQLNFYYCLFIFCSTSLKNLFWFMSKFLFIFLTALWNFHHNIYEQCCLFFFSHFIKYFMQINLFFSYYEIFIIIYINNVIYFFFFIFQNILHESQCQNLIMMIHLTMRKIRNSSNLTRTS